VHVTMRLRREVPSLRSSRRFEVIRRCFKASRGLHGLRLVEFSVLGDHLHLVVEADDNVSLSRGIQGLAVRLARGLNRLLRRTGKLFSDHFHSHLLRSPTEVARAISYVRTNAAHHYCERGADFFSSAAPGAKELLVAGGVLVVHVVLTLRAMRRPWGTRLQALFTHLSCGARWPSRRS